MTATRGCPWQRKKEKDYLSNKCSPKVWKYFRGMRLLQTCSLFQSTLFRRCLKNGNLRNGEEFSARQTQFFEGILDVFQENWGSIAKKRPPLRHIDMFQTSPSDICELYHNFLKSQQKNFISLSTHDLWISLLTLGCSWYIIAITTWKEGISMLLYRCCKTALQAHGGLSSTTGAVNSREYETT